jgi:hypothetical protein
MENFTPIRNGILEHLEHRRMTLLEFGVYVFLQLRADCRTGIYRGCALTIAYQLGEPGSMGQIKDTLARLKRKSYINYSPEKGKKGAYDILIHKFEPRLGRLIGTRLNAWKHEGLAMPEYEALAPESPETLLMIAGQSTENRTYKESRIKNEKLKKTSVPHFTPPSIADVTAYCQQRRNQVDPQRWFDYYTSNGWKVGRNAMRDWKAAVRTWEKNGVTNGRTNQTGKPTLSEIVARETAILRSRADGSAN